MRIQNIIFPSAETCQIDEMYFRLFRNDQMRADGEIKDENVAEKESASQDNCIELNSGDIIRTDTYFNGFSAGKWRKYTTIQNLKVILRFSGIMTVKVYEKNAVKNRENPFSDFVVEEICLLETRLQSPMNEEEAEISIPSWQDGRIIFLEIEAQEKAAFYGGYFASEDDNNQVRDVRIALDICTFRREEYVLRNVDLIRRKIFGSEAYVSMKDSLEVYIVDNARTLEKGDFPEKWIHLYGNPNTGGAGGFTRGLIEIRKDMSKKGLTHALLMDDDILIEAEALFRTWSMLSNIRDEYHEAFVGGAMLRLDKMSIQVEAGAVWNGGELISGKKGLDMCMAEACLENELEKDSEYTAWWYTCIPMTIVRSDNLPMPIFFRGDDVEYGLRNAKKIILMNGICVWHEPFENKYSSVVYYYVMRNRLIDNALHDQVIPKRAFLRMFRNQVEEEIYMFRYKNAVLLMDAVDDYLKGIGWLAAQDAEVLHSKIMKKGYSFLNEAETRQYFDVDSYENCLHQNRRITLLHRIIRRITVNGTFLPAKRKSVTVPAVGNLEINVYRAQEALNYDSSSRRGFLTKRSMLQVRTCMKRLRKILSQVHNNYERINKEYKENFKTVTNEDFWKKYLHLE